MSEHRFKILGVCTAIATMALAGATTAAAKTTTPAAPKALAGAPSGYKVVYSSAYDAPNGVQTGGVVTCPETKKGVQTVPLSGGVDFISDSTGAGVNSSWPSGDEWEAAVNNDSGADSDFYVYAVCAKAPKGYTERESVEEPNNAGAHSGYAFVCPSGDSVLGGGAYSTSIELSVNLQSDFPNTTSTWEIWINNASAVDADVDIYDTCAKINVTKTGYQIDSNSTDNPAGAQSGAVQDCPSGLATLGGGINVTSGSLSVTLNGTYPNGEGWGGYENNASASDNTMTAWAICAT